MSSQQMSLVTKELVLLWVTKFYTQYSMGNIFIRYKFCMISSDMHCQWPTACHQQWEYCISAIKCCSIYFMIMQLTATTIWGRPLVFIKLSIKDFEKSQSCWPGWCMWIMTVWDEADSNFKLLVSQLSLCYKVAHTQYFQSPSLLSSSDFTSYSSSIPSASGNAKLCYTVITNNLLPIFMLIAKCSGCFLHNTVHVLLEH